MNVNIDGGFTFNLPGGREITVDALELDEMYWQIWESAATKEVDGVLVPRRDKDGAIVTDAQGQPVPGRFLDWKADVDGKFGDWLKAQANGIDLKRSEIRGIWESAGDVWAKKNESWRTPAALNGSPILQGSTDPRFADD